MTAAVAGAGAVRAGAVTQAERDNLARKLAAAQAARQPAGERPDPAPAAPQPRPAPTGRARPSGASRGLSARLPGWRGGTAVGNGAGFILGLLVWGWVVLPFLDGGPDRVKAMWRAKFLNQAPDGSWLP